MRHTYYIVSMTLLLISYIGINAAKIILGGETKVGVFWSVVLFTIFINSFVAIFMFLITAKNHKK